MTRKRGLLLLCASCMSLIASRIASAQDDDIRFLPPDSAAPSTEVRSADSRRSESFTGRAYVEDALTAASTPHATVVPFPPPAPPRWMNRTSADVNLVWKPAPAFTVTLSDRGNVLEQEGEPIDTSQTLRNDLREAFVTWEAAPRLYVEAGRINVRHGIALGTNPTDFFKAGSLIAQASLDPSVIRQNRLGTLAVMMSSIWNGGSTSVVFAPKVAAGASLTSPGSSDVDPHLDATNSVNRVLCTQSVELLDLSPELVEYFELHRSKVGINLSKPIGGAIIAYAEFAVGREADLIQRAFDYGVATGSFPASVLAIWPHDANMRVRSDLAAGASYTVGSTLTVNAEYHLHQGGLSGHDFDTWFGAARALSAAPGLASALWYPRGYANYQQEPVAQHQLFVHMYWPRAIVPKLHVSAFAFLNLVDGSSLGSLTVTYDASRAFTIGAFLAVNVGGQETERGSLPQALSGTGVATAYF
jgi:hypothetical protein